MIDLAPARPDLKVLRCLGCGRVLVKHTEAPGLILEIKCRSCRTMNLLRVTASR